VEDFVIGIVTLVLANVLASGRDAGLQRRGERRREARRKGGEAKHGLTERTLEKGSARLTFVVGALLSFPGLAYLVALDHIAKLHAASVVAVVLVVCCCLIQQLLLELPLLGYAFAPDWTEATVRSFKGWIAHRGRHAAVVGLTAIGILLIARGLIGVIS
ncbi:MAG: GAP family protein, partial [Solirubrobacteraceae bacterium]